MVGGGLLVLPTLRRMMYAWAPAKSDPDGPKPASLLAAGAVALAAATLQLAGQRLDWVALGLLVTGLAGLVLGLPRLMPACFAQFGRGLPRRRRRGLWPGLRRGEAFVPLMLVEERRWPLSWPRRADRRQCRLDYRVVAAVAPWLKIGGSTDHAGLPLPGPWLGSTALVALLPSCPTSWRRRMDLRRLGWVCHLTHHWP